MKYVVTILIAVLVTVAVQSQLPLTTVPGEDCPISIIKWGKAYYAPCHDENGTVLHCNVDSDQCLLGYE